jgi:ubiquitin-like protein Pup
MTQERIRAKKEPENSKYLSNKEAKQMQYEAASEQRRNERIGKTATSKEILEETDELLDEIDEILEENAEEFVKSFIQGGGQ